MESQFGFNDIFAAARRRKKTLIMSFFLIFPTVFVVALLLPAIYRAETTILRETQQVSEDFIRSTNTSYAEERLNAATQMVMSRANLLEIINVYNLYPKMRQRKTMGEVVKKMKNSITLETLYAKVTNERTGRFSSINTAFKLSYEGEDPYKVQKVVNTLASLYIEMEEQTSGKRATATTIFFENELKNLNTQMNAYEKKIQQFKEDNMGELPENHATNTRILDKLERELETIDRRLQGQVEKKLFLEGQIATVDPLLPLKTEDGTIIVNPGERLKRLHLQLISLQSTLSDRHPDVIRLKKEIKELEQQVGKSDEAALKVKQLQSLEEEYAAAKGRLGPKHPDMIRLEKEIAAARAEVDQLMTEKVKSDVSEERPDNPTYINLKTRIFVAESEIKNLEKSRMEVEASIEEYQKRIERTPLVEKEYAELTRDYNSLQKKYNDISSKLMEARVAKGMEESQFGERFIVVDPAGLPDLPYKPNRIAIIILGFIFAIGTGVGLVIIQESMDHSIKSVDELNRITGGSVFSTISYIETTREKRTIRIKRIAWTAAITAGIFVSCFIVNRFIIPLDKLWVVMVNRLTTI
jgi:succinoglycan biosynthesis transport protein ExoP